MKSKFLMLITIFFCVAIKSNAQIKAARTLLGGSISYYNTSNPTIESFYTNLQLGKAIKDNTVIGIIGSYSSNNYNSNIVSPNKTKSYSAGIFYRKYAALANNFYFFGEIDASYSYSKNILQYYNNNQPLSSKSVGGVLSFVPGISYSVWKRLQMELSIPSLASLSYSRVTTIDNSLPPSVLPQKRDTYAANVNLNSNVLSSFAIGFKFLLGK
ncbi:MAG: hypothetical protein ABIU11_04665 [Chitinophagaceae bacterium]